MYGKHVAISKTCQITVRATHHNSVDIDIDVDIDTDIDVDSDIAIDIDIDIDTDIDIDILSGDKNTVDSFQNDVIAT